MILFAKVQKTVHERLNIAICMQYNCYKIDYGLLGFSCMSNLSGSSESPWQTVVLLMTHCEKNQSGMLEELDTYLSPIFYF
jgi:hypothetical protein